MSIESRISEMNDHLLEDYSVLELAGADLTNVNKNIVNLKPSWKERLLHFMNYGTQEVWDNWDKREASVTNGTINGTEEAPMNLAYKGNTYQKTTTGKNLFNKNNITYDMLGITENPSAGVTRITASETSACVYIPIVTASGDSYSVSGMGKSYDVAILTSAPVDGGGDAVYRWTYRNTQSGNFSTKTAGWGLNSTCTYLAIFFTPGDSTIAEVVENVQIEKSDAATPYEEYTGGPSPNPSYPQDIHVVSGDNSIEVIGINYFDYDYAYDYSNTILNAYRFVEIKGLKANTTYSIYNYTKPDISVYTNVYLARDTSYSSIIFTNLSEVNYAQVSTDSTGKMFLCAYQSGWTQTKWETFIINFQNAMFIEGNDMSIPYEAYKGASYPISLGVENLFDKSSVTEGYRLSTWGTDYADSVYFVSSFIKVEPNTQYTKNSPTVDAYHRLAYYTNNNVNDFISSVDNLNTFTTPATCQYIRICGLIEEIDSTIVNKGNTTQRISTNPIELCKIGTYQDKIDKSTGKNLLDSIIQGDINTTTGEFTENPNTSFRVSEHYMPVNDTKVGVSYSSSNAGQIVLYEYQSDYTYIGYSVSQTKSDLFTLNSNTKYIKVRLRGEGTTSTDITNAMVSNGSLLEYEPYGTNWYLKKEIGKVVLNGSENWSVFTATHNGYTRFLIATAYTPKYNFGTLGGYSNYFITGETSGTTETNLLDFRTNRNMLINTNIESDVNDFKTWLSTHNTTLYYVLATPTYETITDTTLLSQLEAIKKSYDNQTNISQENNVLPFELSVVALSDGTAQVSLLSAPLLGSMSTQEEPETLEEVLEEPEEEETDNATTEVMNEGV